MRTHAAWQFSPPTETLNKDTHEEEQVFSSIEPVLGPDDTEFPQDKLVPAMQQEMGSMNASGI